MDDTGKPGRFLLKNQAWGKCVQQYSGSAPTFARLYACTATSGWQNHSFDVR